MKVLFLQPQSPVIKPKTMVVKTKTSVIDCHFHKYTMCRMRLSSFYTTFFKTYGCLSAHWLYITYYSEQIIQNYFYRIFNYTCHL